MGRTYWIVLRSGPNTRTYRFQSEYTSKIYYILVSLLHDHVTVFSTNKVLIGFILITCYNRHMHAEDLDSKAA